MNLQLQIGLGVAIGLIIGFFMILNTINTKEKRLIDAYNKLNETLNIRYFKLKSVLNNLKLYMSEFQREIADLERVALFPEESVTSKTISSSTTVLVILSVRSPS